jgi:mannose-6-phosphate isomerase
MFVAITNNPRPYAWGSSTAIAELLGHAASGGPEAELWLGAHPGSPSMIVDPSAAGGARSLPGWIATSPQLTLGPFAATGQLPFLLKILAAEHPLSLQAHPTAEQAAAGFARENALGIPLDALHRNYKDAFPKPELIYALSETFDALCGFRPLDEVRALLRALLDLDARAEDPQPQPLEDLLQQLSSDDALPAVFEWLISSGAGAPTLVSLVTRLAPLSSDPSLVTAAALAVDYPDDPGIVISLLLNRVTLARGEALYLPAGNIHAYLHGVGVELMAASDNVMRGGLTPKHIDVPELLGVLDFTPGPVPYLRASGVGSASSSAEDSDVAAAGDAGVAGTSGGSGVEVFRTDVPDFVLVRVADAVAGAQYPLTGPGIAICTSGSIHIAGAGSSVTLGHGESVYITPDEGMLTFAGDGELFLATTGQ